MKPQPGRRARANTRQAIGGGSGGARVMPASRGSDDAASSAPPCERTSKPDAASGRPQWIAQLAAQQHASQARCSPAQVAAPNACAATTRTPSDACAARSHAAAPRMANDATTHTSSRRKTAIMRKGGRRRRAGKRLRDIIAQGVARRRSRATKCADDKKPRPTFRPTGVPVASPRAENGPRRAHIFSIITWPNPEHDTCVAPSIRRAKS